MVESGGDLLGDERAKVARSRGKDSVCMTHCMVSALSQANACVSVSKNESFFHHCVS